MNADRSGLYPQNMDYDSNDVDQFSSFSQFMNMHDCLEPVEISATTENEIHLEHQATIPDLSGPDMQNELRTRTVKLNLERVKLQLEQNKLEQELLALEKQQQLSVIPRTSVTIPPQSQILHPTQSLPLFSLGSTEDQDQSCNLFDLMLNGSTGSLDMNVETDHRLDDEMFSNAETNLRLLASTNLDENESTVDPRSISGEMQIPDSLFLLPGVKNAASRHAQTSVPSAGRSRKRKLGAKQDVEQKVSIFKQKLSKLGVPSHLVHAMKCQNCHPDIAEGRPNTRKQRRKESEPRGRNCLLCRFLHQHCDRELPVCGTCKLFIEKWSSSSTAFRWNCDVRTSLLELNVFNLGIGSTHSKDSWKIWLATSHDIDRALDELTHNHRMRSIRVVNPQTRGRLGLEPDILSNQPKGNVMCGFRLTSNIHWRKDILTRPSRPSNPRIDSLFIWWKREYDRYIVSLLSVLDNVHKLPASFSLSGSIVLAWLYDDLCCFRQKYPAFENERAVHLEAAVYNFLQIFCSRISVDQKTKSSCSRSRATTYLKVLLRGIGLVDISSNFLDGCGRRKANPTPHYTGVCRETPVSVAKAQVEADTTVETGSDSAPTPAGYCDWVASCMLPKVLGIFNLTEADVAAIAHRYVIDCGSTNDALVLPRCWPHKESIHYRVSVDEFDDIATYYFQSIFVQYLEVLFANGDDPVSRTVYKVIPERGCMIDNSFQKRVFYIVLASTLTILHAHCGNKDHKFLSTDLRTFEVRDVVLTLPQISLFKEQIRRAREAYCMMLHRA